MKVRNKLNEKESRWSKLQKIGMRMVVIGFCILLVILFIFLVTGKLFESPHYLGNFKIEDLTEQDIIEIERRRTRQIEREQSYKSDTDVPSDYESYDFDSVTALSYETNGMDTISATNAITSGCINITTTLEYGRLRYVIIRDNEIEKTYECEIGENIISHKMEKDSLYIVKVIAENAKEKDFSYNRTFD